MSRYEIHTKIMAVPGKRDQLAMQLLKAARLVMHTPGCEKYFVSVSQTEPEPVLVTEVWTTKDHHDASLLAHAVKSLIQETRPLIDRSSEAIVSVPLGGKGLQTEELAEE